MRDFTWQVFEKTGDIETYLLYRACSTEMEQESNEESVEEFSNADTDLYGPQ